MESKSFKEPAPRLAPDALYLGDNGRCFCGSPRCAGSSALYTGRDISGQRVYRITPEDAAYAQDVEKITLKCETCGKAASRLHGAGR